MATIEEIFGLALKQHQSGNLAEAERLYRQLLDADPFNAHVHGNLGLALQAAGRSQEALDSFMEAVRLDPGHADANNNLGIALNDQGYGTEAIGCYRQALHIDPDHAQAHNNLGIALVSQGQLAEAIQCFQQALRINPGYVKAKNNLGNALKNYGQLAEAAECYRHILHADPGHKATLWNTCLLHLLQGDYENGWPDFELRWTLPGFVPRSFTQPRWNGAPLDGKTILVYAEQGLGDTIQFLRYLPLVQRRGGLVLFEHPPALSRLLTGVAGANQTAVAGAPLPPFDVHIPLLSLPGLFGTTLATIPATVPYLSAEPPRIANWRQQFESVSGFKVGIAWRGNPKYLWEPYRSVPLANFEPLARVESVKLISLQKGPGTDQLAAVRDRFSVLDLSDRLDAEGAFVDTAAVMMNMDLIVTGDTAVAHLAGALGVPVWMALPVASEWRWLLERWDSPWYPTMRLFRQRRFGDWGEVFERIAEELESQIRNSNIEIRNKSE